MIQTAVVGRTSCPLHSSGILQGLYMSKPRKDYDDKKQGAIIEIISGLSALHMEPMPLNNGELFMSDNDHWVKHAVEHFHAAIELLRNI